MTLGRMPLYVWMMLVVSGMTLIILPPLSAAQIMLLLDRFLGAHFFDTQAGGSAVLWQHFFWFFGHPEVYVLMVPGFGFVSEIIPVFSRKVIFGYAMVAASAASASYRHGGLGASYVRGGDGQHAECPLRGLDHAGGGADRGEDLQLAGDDIRRPPALRDADALLSGLPVPISVRGLTGIMMSVAPLTGSSATPTSWWRISILS